MPERLVSTAVLGNLHDPSYELLLRRELGGVFETDELILDWDQADAPSFVGLTELGRAIEIRRDASAAGERLADGDVLATERSGVMPVAVVVRLRSAEVYLVEVDRMDPVALAHACWEIGNMHAPLFRDDSDDHTVPCSRPCNRCWAACSVESKACGYLRSRVNSMRAGGLHLALPTLW